MKNTCPFYNVFQVLKVLLIKICKIQPPDFYFLLLVVFISFCINRYHFSKIFRTSFNIIWKKIFVTNFPFLTDSLTPAKRDKSFLSMLPYVFTKTWKLANAASASENKYKEIMGSVPERISLKKLYISESCEIRDLHETNF